MMEVKLEGISSEHVGFGYTDDNGEFTIRDIMVRPDQYYYLVIEAEGFKPVRQRLEYRLDLVYGGHVTVFLESAPDAPRDPVSGKIVDVKQLGIKIPDKAMDEYKLSLKESTAGNYPRALEHLEKATKLAPDFYEAQNNLGAQYLRLKRHTEAETAFEKARKLSPTAAEPLLNLGGLYYQEGESLGDSGKAEESVVAFGKAVDFLEEAIRRSPASAQAHHYLGAALYKTSTYERAETVLHDALKLDSNLGDIRLTLFNVYMKQSRYAEALEQVTVFLKQNPKAPQRESLERTKEQLEHVVEGVGPR